MIEYPMMYLKQQNLSDQKYNAIDLAKFFCAILVVTAHIPPLGASASPITFYCNFGIQQYIARIAVPFFFAASGFLLYRKTTLNDFKVGPIKKYVVKLLKLYAIWSIIYFPFAYLGYFRGSKDLIHSCLVYMRNIIFDGSAPHLWYFPALIFAVCLISLLLHKGVKPKTIAIIAFCFYFVGLFAQSWFGFIAPLEKYASELWQMLKLTQSVIVTTRDGLFDAFFFVSIGMLFAYYDFDLGVRKSLGLFILSMMAMGVEIYLLQHNGFIREYDMYLFLAPTLFFFFSFVLNVKLTDRPIYMKLRLTSSLIFFSHVWIYWGFPIVLNWLHWPMLDDRYHFVFVLAVSMLFSCTVIKLSDFKYLKWLKHLYS